MPTVDLGSVVGPQGPQGVQGPQGPQGIQGDTGPNAVSAETNTNLTGLLYGNGSKVGTKEITDAPASGSGALLTSGGAYDALQTMVRPNLIDNGYFVGGGSQQGVGKFPINQRAGYVVPDGVTYYSDSALTTSAGTTSAYTTAVYVNTTYGTIAVRGTTYYVAYGDMVPGSTNTIGIDRWTGGVTGAVFLLSDDYLTIRAPSNYFVQPFQRHENYEHLKGKTAVFSALLGDGTLVSKPITIGNSGVNLVQDKFSVFSTDDTMLYLRAHAGAEVRLKAVKLELGSMQTLAHQENGVWVPNEVPSFQQELAKCQRYQFFPETAYSPNVMLALSTSILVGNVYFPVIMRNAPTVSIDRVRDLVTGRDVPLDGTAFIISRNTQGIQSIRGGGIDNLTVGRSYAVSYHADSNL